MKPVYSPSRWGEIYHALPYDEVLGGGAAGPGKSLVLLMDPMQQIVVEHQRMQKGHPFHIEPGMSTGWALHLRRTIKQLEQNIIRTKRIFPIVDPGAKFDEQKTTWTFTSGYHFQFGHCQNSQDWQAYLSGEFCMAAGQRVVMADGSLRAIENVDAGEYVKTLEGPRRVTATWATGRKPCVRVDVRHQKTGDLVGTQVHPTTHPVLLSTSGQSQGPSSPSSSQNARKALWSEYVWQDYESLLCGRPESPVKRVSLVSEESAGEAYCDSLQGRLPLRELTVPVVLHEQTSRQALQRLRSSTGSDERPEAREPSSRTPQGDRPHPQDSAEDPPPTASDSPRVVRYSADLFVCGDEGEPLDLGTPKGLLVGCSSSLDLRDEQPRSGLEIGPGSALRSAYVASPGRLSLPSDVRAEILRDSPAQERSYPHFYSGESRSRSEDVHTGIATIRFDGWHETYDLTVDGANHYISESGLVNAQTHIGYDELVTFLEEQYENINLRLRSTDPVLRKMLRIRAMTNPMVIRDSGENYSIDPYWVRKRFVDPAPKGGVVLEERTKRSTGQVVVKTRFYSHATLYDNPDPEFVQQYEAKLLFAKPHIRAAMLHGNWYVTAGSFFGDEWNERMHVIRPHFIPPEWPRFRSMDWGYKKPGCVQWYAMDPDENLICEREMMFQGQTARQVAERVKKAEMGMKLWKDGRSQITGPADTQLWEKRGDEGLSKAEEFAAAGIQWVPADKRSRSRNAERVSERLKDHDSGTAMPGLVFFDTCKDIVKMLPTIQTDKDDPDTPQDGGNDHSFDTLMYACAFASRGRVGIPRLGRKEDDEYGDESEDKPEASRGNSWGYGSAV